MFSPAHSPDWRATRAELGKDLVRVLVGDPRDVAGREHLGMALDAEVGPDGDAVAALRARCRATARSGSPACPAPHTSVCALSSLPDLSLTRVGAIAETSSPTITSTPNFSSVFFVYLRMSGLNIVKSSGPASTRISRACFCGMSRVVLREDVAVELGEGADALDAGRAAADDDHVERAVVDQRRDPCRPPPTARARACAGAARRRACTSGTRARRRPRAEEVDAGAEPDHEVVVGCVGFSSSNVTRRSRRGRCRSRSSGGR